MRGGALESPVELSPEEAKGLALIGVGLPATLKALVALESSLVSLVRTANRSVWIFRHPTIGDAYASIVAEDPELLDIYMSWTSAEKLLSEVTCGDVGLDGAKVIIPINRFEHFLLRLREVSRDKLLTFLASRCSRAFLILYLERHPNLGDEICEPRSYLSAVSEVDLLVRLYELDILPEEWRSRFVRRARTLAVETPDVDFLSVRRIRAVFKESDLAEILQVLRDELLPNLSDVVWDWRISCDRKKDPEDEFVPLMEMLTILRTEFAGDASVQTLLDSAEESVNDAIQEMLENNPRPGSTEHYSYDRNSYASGADERSVFDDVDS